MGLGKHGVDDVVVQLGMLLLEHPRRVDEVHLVAHQRHHPADHGGREHDEPRGEPGPANPRRQATRDQPVFHDHTAGKPEHGSDARREQERGQRHALEVGTGRRQTFREIPLRF